jgi:hypothetical protein
MTFRGHIKNGTVVVDNPLELPDGTEVSIAPIGAEVPLPPTWAEVLGDVIGSAPGLPDDFATNHDHYIHGAGKR